MPCASCADPPKDAWQADIATTAPAAVRGIVVSDMRVPQRPVADASFVSLPVVSSLAARRKQKIGAKVFPQGSYLSGICTP